MYLSRSKQDIWTLNSAADISYIMGIWSIVAAIAAVAAVVIVLVPFITSVGYGSSETTIFTDLFGAISSIMWVLIAIAGITVFIEILFGYYLYEVGSMYEKSSLKLAGVLQILISIGSIMTVLLLYRVLAILGAGGGYVYSSDFLVVIFGVMIAGVLGLMSFIALIIGVSGMKNETGISDFNTAMWLIIVGLFVGITYPIGLMLFGSGLRKLAKQSREERATGPSAPVEMVQRAPSAQRAVYCPYCGARIEAEASFCPTCGSSLRR